MYKKGAQATTNYVSVLQAAPVEPIACEDDKPKCERKAKIIKFLSEAMKPAADEFRLQSILKTRQAQMKKSVRFPEDENDLTQITYFGDSCPASPLIDPVARAQLNEELAKMEPLCPFSLPSKVEL